MYSTVNSALLDGIRTIPVAVEVDISNGMPAFDMVGYLSPEVREAKERVKTALHNCGVVFPAKRITVNLAPANIRKSGTGFDLPVAVAILCALGLCGEQICQNRMFIGEISLNGAILSVPGILPMVSDAYDRGITEVVVPADNQAEAELIAGVKVFAFSNLTELMKFLSDGEYHRPKYSLSKKTQDTSKEPDFSEVNGQRLLRRACEVAACGMHNMLMVGPPGAGKTMISERMAGILPPLSEEEKLEISKIYSVCGLLRDADCLVDKRPFRHPHHTITTIGLTGGGSTPKPGELSLAHGGVLFLDELPEFQKTTLEVLRQPLESHDITLVRANSCVTYPANFLLLAAMNPCNCGHYPNLQKCRCTQAARMRYMNRISQPLLDRMDICVEASAMSYHEIAASDCNESTQTIRARVEECQRIQSVRFREEPFFRNSQIPSAKIVQYCPLDEKEQAYMQDIFKKEMLTARSYHKILRVARTIADMDKSEQIQMKHLKEAVCYRSIDKRFWGGH